MTKIKKILVPVDFSPFSTNALIYGAQLAKATGALLEIANIHFVDDPDLRAELQPKLTTFLDEVITKSGLPLVDVELKKPEPKDIPCKIVIRQGFIVDEIVSYANQFEVDLIVMGTRGAGVMKQYILGTNTADVIEKAECPVISVPGQAVYNGFNTILFAFEFQEKLIEKVTYLYELAGKLGASLQLVHVKNDKNQVAALDDKLADFKKALKLKKLEGINIQIIDTIENVNSSIVAYCKSVKPDILALAPGKHTYYQRLFGKSVTKRLSFHTETPVLSVKV